MYLALTTLQYKIGSQSIPVLRLLSDHNPEAIAILNRA